SSLPCWMASCDFRVNLSQRIAIFLTPAVTRPRSFAPLRISPAGSHSAHARKTAQFVPTYCHCALPANKSSPFDKRKAGDPALQPIRFPAVLSRELLLQSVCGRADLDLFGFGFGTLGQGHFQYTLVVRSFHFLTVNRAGQPEGASEGAIAALDAMEVLFL